MQIAFRQGEKRFVCVLFAIALSLAATTLRAQAAHANDPSLDIELHGTITPEKIGMHETQTFEMSQGIKAASGSTVNFTITTNDHSVVRLRLYLDGKPVELAPGRVGGRQARR